MNLIYNNPSNETNKDTDYLISKDLRIEYNKEGMKLEPIKNERQYYIITKNSSKYFLPPQFKIEFDIVEIKDSINICIGNEDLKNIISLSTKQLDLNEGINHITVLHNKGSTIFKNGKEIKYNENKDLGYKISFYFDFVGEEIINKSIILKNIKITTDIATFCVFGTCISRDIFNSDINPGYKNYFKIEETLVRSSIISLMDEPVEFDEKDVVVPGSNRLKNDLDKRFLEHLKEIQPEYLMLDISSDIKEGNLEIDNNKIITNNLEDLSQSEFYKNLKYKREIKIQENQEEFLDKWKERCNLFFNFMDNNCPNTIIILNSAKDVTKLLNKSGKIEKIKKYEKIARNTNPYRIILEEYICKNFDVEVLDFNYRTLAYEEHKWGANTLHYEPFYYKNMTKQLNEIISRNRLAKTDVNIKFNNEIKKLRKEKLIYKNKAIETDIYNKKLMKKLDLVMSSNSWKLTKPLRSFKNKLTFIIKL